MKHLLIAALCLSGLLYLAACHKHDTNPKQYSTWIVNEQDTFRTNNVDTEAACNPDHSDCGADISSYDSKNWFHIGFYSDHLPVEGKIPLGDFIQQPPDLNDFAFVYFYYQGNGGYIPLHPELDTLYIHSDNGKIYYELVPPMFAKQQKSSLN
jgi:hypothetical protein